MRQRPGKLTCPVCDAVTEVVDTQLDPAGDGIQRRRKCANGHRFKTFEARVGVVWDQDRHVVPVAEDMYDEQVLAARLTNEVGGVDEM